MEARDEGTADAMRADARPARPVLTREEYLRRWPSWHGQARVDGIVGFWLRLTYALARPLAVRGVAPDVLTVLGVIVSAAVVAPAAAGERWLLLAVPVVVVAGVLDNLDGAVAVVTGRASRWGFVLDSVCDRLSDAAYAVALFAAGAPGWLCVVAGGLAWLQEYARARAGAAGVSEVGVVSVAERPTRVIVTAVFLCCGGVFVSDRQVWAGAGAAVWTALGVIGFVQVAVALRARLLQR